MKTFLLLNRIKTVTLLLGMCLLGSWVYLHLNWPDKYVHLTVCDVGQGDAILIYQGFHQILIDSSQDDRVLGCLNHFLPPWDRELEAVIITHFDRDHVGGLASILETYRIKLLHMADPPPNFNRNNSELAVAIDSAIHKGMEWKKPFLGQQIGLGFSLVPASLEVVQALSSLSLDGQVISSNNQSIVLLLQVGAIKTLLTGDMETQGELILLANKDLGQIELLKIGHHGAKNSTSVALLEKVQPKFGLISVAETNAYGHPAPETLAKLARFEVTVLKTSEVGNITFSFDGTNYWQQ